MKIHKAGYSVILVYALIAISIILLLIYFKVSKYILYPAEAAFFILFMFIIRFFRSPKRNIVFGNNQVIAPADGKVVAIEEIDEKEFINGKCIQISIFMSIWNVHINWAPVLGKVLSTNHFNGRYMAAWLPKSSEENERQITLIESINSGKILVRQIAGAIARRIITYVDKGDEIKTGKQLGFIRFGSRVDVLIPVNSDIKVKLNDKVKGGESLIAELFNK